MHLGLTVLAITISLGTLIPGNARLLATNADTSPANPPQYGRISIHTPAQILRSAWLPLALAGGMALMGYLCLRARRRDRLSRSLLEINPDLIFQLDGRGRIVYASPAAAGYFDTVPHKLNGKELTNLFSDTEKRKELAHCIELVVLNVKPLEQEFWLDTNRGRSVFNLRLIPERDGNGRSRGVAVIARDTTDHRRQQEERNIASRLESLGVLAGGIAHEFNNVLTGILGNLSLASLIGNFTGQVGQMLDNAEKSCLRARELTGRLLIFASGGSPRKELVELAKLIRITAHKKLAGTKASVQYDSLSRLDPVWADPAQLTGAVSHIIDNALWATGQQGRIEIAGANVQLDQNNPSGLPAGRYVRISFRDDGPGIADDIRAKIFDPYFSTREQGSGLGLTTTYFILNRHGGTIELENRPERGAAFVIHLPVSTEPTDDTPPVSEKPSRNNPARILLMDDEPGLRVISEKIIRHLGYQVMTAADGEEAIAIYQQAIEAGHGIDLVILDMTVPGGMGGLETIKRLKQLDPNVSAIASSDYSTDPVISSYRDFGFVGAIPKPYCLDELEKVISDLV